MKVYRLIISAWVMLVAVSSTAQPRNIDSLQRIVALEKHDSAEMKALFYLAAANSRSDGNKAKFYLAQNIRVASQGKNYEMLCASYAMLLTLHQEEGNTDSASLDVEKLTAFAALEPNNKKIQTNYNQSMGLYHRKNGNYKLALPFCIAAVKLSEAANVDKSSVAGQWLNAGVTYGELGDYNNSLDCYLKSLRLFTEDANKLGESFCYTNIAATYISLKQFDKALGYAQKGLELKKSIADKRGVCTSLDAIGNAYMGMKNLPAAFTNFQSALKIAIEEKMVNEEATSYFNMAKIFAHQQKDSLAAVYFGKTKKLAEAMGNKTIAADALMELSALNKNADSLRNIENVFAIGLQTFKDAGSLEKVAENYQRIAEYYRENKKFDKALDYTNKYHKIVDSIQNNELQVQIAKMEEQYNVEKKEQEIVLLKKDGELQQQKLFRQRILFGSAAVLLLLSLLGIALLVNRNKLRQRMKELELRNQIAADLHDEVGSSLSSIHMLSQMATTDVNEARHKDILQRMSSNAKETMDKMGDIVWMIKPGETEAASLKQRMERFAYEICSSKNIELQMQLDDLDKIKLTMEQRKNIYLIFKEALNNAVKYSGAERITIKASASAKQLELQVNDNGKGFEPTIAKRGNGLQNMKHRAKELGSTIFIDSVIDVGTGIRLQLII